MLTRPSGKKSARLGVLAAPGRTRLFSSGLGLRLDRVAATVRVCPGGRLGRGDLTLFGCLGAELGAVDERVLLFVEDGTYDLRIIHVHLATICLYIKLPGSVCKRHIHIWVNCRRRACIFMNRCRA